MDLIDETEPLVGPVTFVGFFNLESFPLVFVWLKSKFFSAFLCLFDRGIVCFLVESLVPGFEVPETAGLEPLLGMSGPEEPETAGLEPSPGMLISIWIGCEMSFDVSGAPTRGRDSLL